MKKTLSFFLTLGLLFSLNSIAQEYVQTTTNSTYANKSFRTAGKFSIGASNTELIGGSPLNIQTTWGNWMALVDGYKKDVYAFHNPNNGGRMELFIHDGVTDSNQFGVFSILRNGYIGMGTNAPAGRLHVKGETYVDGGWLRVKGQKGIFFQDYGGGFYMKDNSWIRTYGNKNFYHNTGVMRTDGTFQVGGNGDRFVVNTSGNVGIGVVSPSSKLDVNGKTTVNSLKIDGNNTTSSVNGFLNKIEFTGGGHGALVFHPGQADELMFGLHTNGNFYWGTGRSATKPNYYAMYLDGDKGNLGIRGKLTASEVQVKVGGWADYVFKNNYPLPSLSQVENHINQKGHLINIPSAKEVEQKGIDLGEMNKLLLEKIEELTLYTIAQEKQLNAQKSINLKLEESNKNLNSRLSRLEKLLN